MVFTVRITSLKLQVFLGCFEPNVCLEVNKNVTKTKLCYHYKMVMNNILYVKLARTCRNTVSTLLNYLKKGFNEERVQCLSPCRSCIFHFTLCNSVVWRTAEEVEGNPK